MKSYMLPTLAAAAAIHCCAYAQSAAPAAPAKPVIDYAARERSVVTLKERIAQREERYQALRKDLTGLNNRMEERIDFIVNKLSSLQDSNNSGIRISELKITVINKLRRSISLYRWKQREVFQQERQDRVVSEAEIASDMKVFNDSVDKRIAQIVELAKSMPGYKDVPKYEQDSGTYYASGWFNETSRINDAWRQNQRASAVTSAELKKLVKETEAAIADADSRRRDLANSISNGRLSKRDLEIKEGQLGRTDALLDNLRQRRIELAIPGEESGRELGMTEACDVAKMVAEASKDVSSDFWEIISKYDVLARERAYLRGLNANLKAREEWLKNNPPPSE